MNTINQRLRTLANSARRLSDKRYLDYLAKLFVTHADHICKRRLKRLMEEIESGNVLSEPVLNEVNEIINDIYPRYTIKLKDLLNEVNHEKETK